MDKGWGNGATDININDMRKEGRVEGRNSLMLQLRKQSTVILEKKGEEWKKNLGKGVRKNV